MKGERVPRPASGRGRGVTLEVSLMVSWEGAWSLALLPRDPLS